MGGLFNRALETAEMQGALEQIKIKTPAPPTRAPEAVSQASAELLPEEVKKRNKNVKKFGAQSLKISTTDRSPTVGSNK